MDAKEVFQRALATATEVVDRVNPADYNLPTPDTEWSVRILIEHMLRELAWTADLVEGKTIDEVGTKYNVDLIGKDLHDSWHEKVHAAQKAVQPSDLTTLTHLSYGDVTTEDYLRQAATDQLIHSWDLAVATGQRMQFDTEVAQTIYDDIAPRAQTMHDSGLFAPPLDIPVTSDIQTKLLALFGRDANWHKPVAEIEPIPYLSLKFEGKMDEKDS